MDLHSFYLPANNPLLFGWFASEAAGGGHLELAQEAAGDGHLELAQEAAGDGHLELMSYLSYSFYWRNFYSLKKSMKL